jgi:serine/threonine protein kinase
MGRRVAIKILRAHTRPSPTAPLVHRNVVTVYDVGVFEGDPFLVMELLEGAPLVEYLEAASPSFNQKIDLMLQICDGLQAAHDHGVVHGDLRAGDVFVQKDGGVKLLNLGLEPAGTQAADVAAAATLFTAIAAGDATQDLKDALARPHQSAAQLGAGIERARHITSSTQYRTQAAAFDRYKKIEALIDERRNLGRRLKIAEIDRICDAEAARLAAKFPVFARSTKADLLPVSEQDESAALAELQSWHNEQLAAVAVLRTVSGQP